MSDLREQIRNILSSTNTSPNVEDNLDEIMPLIERALAEQREAMYAAIAEKHRVTIRQTAADPQRAENHAGYDLGMSDAACLVRDFGKGPTP